MTAARPSPARTAWTFLRLCWASSPRLTLLTLVVLPFGTALLAVQAIWMRMLVNGAIERDVALSLTAAALIGLTRGLDALLFSPTAMLQLTFGERTSILINRRFADHANSVVDLSLHEDPEAQDHLSLLGRPGAFNNLPYVAAPAVSSVLGMLTTGVLLVSIHPALLLILLVALPSVFAAAGANRIVRKAERRAAVHQRLADHWYTLSRQPASNRELRVYGRQEWALEAYRRSSEQARALKSRSRAQAAALGLGAAFVTTLGFVAALAFVIYRATNGSATVGEVVTVVFLLPNLLWLVNGLYAMMRQVQDALRTVERYVWLSDRVATEPRPRARPAPAAPPDTSGLCFEHVSFAYPGSEREVLHDVTLEVPRGMVLAIVGDNGAGKTTLAKLCSRLYEPTTGRILFDGEDIAALDVDAWRSRVTACYQDFARLEVTVRETVGLGSLPEMDDAARVERALAEARATELVAALPAGIETQLGRTWPGGVELSLGQWQRLALARGWMRLDAPLTILDEPSASLDALAEYELFEAARARSRRLANAGAVTILISHRFSTVQMADLIVVLNDGVIKEQGSHTELMQLGGIYAELYTLQAAEYEGTSTPVLRDAPEAD